MRLEILDLARDDLVEGFQFYEDKEPGLATYFLASLYADIESMKWTRGHLKGAGLLL